MIEALFRWLGATWVGMTMRHSTWGFAAVETVHLLALAALGGAVIAANLTAARVLFRRADGPIVTRAAFPIMLGALAVMVASGVLLVASKPVRYYLDDLFRAKMALLALAIVASLLVQRLATRPLRSPAFLRSSALASLLLWLGVGVCGRLIGFL